MQGVGTRQTKSRFVVKLPRMISGPFLTQSLRGPWEQCLHMGVRFVVNSIFLFFLKKLLLIL